MPAETFVPSENELQLAARLLETNSWNRSDTLSVDVAIDIFKRTGLSFKQIREIWTIADKNATGRLSKEELTVAIRLMGWVQAGKPLEENLMWKLGPLPMINGITDTIVKAVEPSIPPMTCENVSTFKQTFMKSSPIYGLLHKHEVMEIYMRSKPDLSFEELVKIMALVRCNKDGGVDFRNFAIGMHVIEGLNACLITSIPPTIPSVVYQVLEDDEYPLSPSTSTPVSSEHPLSLSQTSVEDLPLSSIAGQGDIQLLQKVESDINISNFKDVFSKLGPVNGLLDRETAKEAFRQYKISSDQLQQIMSHLSGNGDTVDFCDFTFGMHLVQTLKPGVISSVSSPEVYKILALSPGPSSPYPELVISKPLPQLPKLSQDNSPCPSQSAEEVEPCQPQLPEKVESDLRACIQEIEKYGSISGGMTIKFQLGYGLQPADMAQIWSQSDLESNQSLTPERLAMIKRVLRQKLADKVKMPLFSSPISTQERLERPPPSHPMSSTTNLTNVLTCRPDQQEVNSDSTYQSHSLALPLTASDPPEYALFSTALPLNTPPSQVSQPHNSITQDILNGFKEEITRLTGHLQRIDLDQTAVQNQLRYANDALRRENDQFSLREQLLQAEVVRRENDQASLRGQALQADALRTEKFKLREQLLEAELARKEMEFDQSEKLVSALRWELLEQQVSMQEAEEALLEAMDVVDLEVDELRKTIKVQNMQIVNLTELVADMGKAISEARPNPENHDLRTLFLRASLRDSQASTTKAAQEAEDLRQMVETQAQKIVELQQRLADMEMTSSKLAPKMNNEFSVLRREVNEGIEIIDARMQEVKNIMERVFLSDESHGAWKGHATEVEVVGPPIKSSLVGLDPESLPISPKDLSKVDSSMSPSQPSSPSYLSPSTPLVHALPSPNQQRRSSPPPAIPRLAGIQEDISLHEFPELESDLRFLKLDLERKGYFGPDIVQRFVSKYNIEAADLTEIGELADDDDRLMSDKVDTAIILIKQKLANTSITFEDEDSDSDSEADWGSTVSLTPLLIPFPLPPPEEDIDLTSMPSPSKPWSIPPITKSPLPLQFPTVQPRTTEASPQNACSLLVKNGDSSGPNNEIPKHNKNVQEKIFLRVESNRDRGVTKQDFHWKAIEDLGSQSYFLKSQFKQFQQTKERLDHQISRLGIRINRHQQRQQELYQIF